MTIRNMKIFVAVYQTGNITKAAKQLYMTQPVVTRAIQELEHYYGVKLFERINQRLSVTEAGNQFYSFAVHIIDSFDQMEKSLRNWDKIGIIRVGASANLGSMLLPKVLKEYQALHTDIKVKATVTSGIKLQSMLENNELDLALIEEGITNENLIADELGEDRLMLLIPPDSELLTKKELYLSDLLSYPFILRENESVNRILVNNIFAAHNFTINPVIESISAHAIIQSVHEGLGISFLPSDHFVQHSIEAGFVRTRLIKDENFLRKNYIVWHKNKFLSKSAKDFIALCHTKVDSSKN